MAAFVARFEHPTEPERDEYRRHSTRASVSLRAGAGWFGFAIASANAAGDPGCRCRGHRNEQAALWLLRRRRHNAKLFGILSVAD
jgi:hypothetical protein